MFPPLSDALCPSGSIDFALPFQPCLFPAPITIARSLCSSPWIWGLPLSRSHEPSIPPSIPGRDLLGAGSPCLNSSSLPPEAVRLCITLQPAVVLFLRATKEEVGVLSSVGILNATTAAAVPSPPSSFLPYFLGCGSLLTRATVPIGGTT